MSRICTYIINERFMQVLQSTISDLGQEPKIIALTIQREIVCPSIGSIASDEIRQLRNEQHIQIVEAIEVYLSEKLNTKIERSEGADTRFRDLIPKMFEEEKKGEEGKREFMLANDQVS